MNRRAFLQRAAAASCAMVFPHVTEGQVADSPQLTPDQLEKQRRDWAQIAFKNHFAPPRFPAVSGMLQTGFFRDSIYYLLAPIGWTPDANETHYQPVEVPKYFVTDLASIPPLFYEYLTPTGTYAYAAVVHDYLYWTQDRSKDEADDILLMIMKEFSVRADKAWAIHKAVQDAGGSAWKQNAELKKSGEGRILKTLPTDPRTNWSDWRKDHAHFADSIRS
jgi:Protein of unknown function (DUF1353)